MAHPLLLINWSCVSLQGFLRPFKDISGLFRNIKITMLRIPFFWDTLYIPTWYFSIYQNGSYLQFYFIFKLIKILFKANNEPSLALNRLLLNMHIFLIFFIFYIFCTHCENSKVIFEDDSQLTGIKPRWCNSCIVWFFSLFKISEKNK